nr:ABC transporter ATP-binding protein [Bryobacter sp.]
MVIEVEGLRKSYGEVEAVRGVDFAVAPGEVFGLLGPNGAGKTTTVEILEGLRARSGGTVRVLGCDPGVDVLALKERIGVCLQHTNLPEKMTVAEALELFGSLYAKRGDAAKLLDRLQLKEKRNAFYSTLSGGQKQRLAIALALINEPQLVFFDEPTTGLDPQVRLEIHALIQELRRDQCTVVLTTHYIEEAERLCDRVAIVDEGRIVALGTPREIQARTLGHSRIDIQVEQPIADLPAPAQFAAESLQLDDNRRHLTVAAVHPARTIAELVKWIDQQGLGLADIHLKRPTLEDV